MTTGSWRGQRDGAICPEVRRGDTLFQRWQRTNSSHTQDMLQEEKTGASNSNNGSRAQGRAPRFLSGRSSAGKRVKGPSPGHTLHATRASVSPCGITRDLFWIKISAWTCELYSADRHAPLDAHHNSLHLQIHDLRGKRDSADWTKVTEPKRRGQPGPSGWAPSKRLRQPTSPHCGHRECDYEGTAREMYPHQGMQVPLGAGTGRGPPLPSRLLKEQSPADTWFERFWPPEG